MTREILIVEDNEKNMKLVRDVLQAKGYATIEAVTGEDGVRLAKERLPALVLMDIQLPGINGIEALKQLRADPATASIPVIAVTASALGDIRQTAREAGCVDYLSKPIRAQQLFGMLRTHLRVHLVSGSEHAARSEQGLDAQQRGEVATRLRTAVGLGDVSDIQQLADQLMRGTAAEATVGERINRLVNDFDFDGLGEFANSLTA